MATYIAIGWGVILGLILLVLLNHCYCSNYMVVRKSDIKRDTAAHFADLNRDESEPSFIKASLK